MRMIIRDYIASLREEGELDQLLSDLFFIKKIIPQTKITKGAKQRGVDKEAVGPDHQSGKRLYIITVKCGDLTRNAWAGDKNAVRQSLDQIREIHLRLLPLNLKKLPCTLIVATNGEIKQTVDDDWKGYIEANSSEKLEFEFWGLQRISDEIDENVIPHAMFSGEQMSLFRKTLALITEIDYDLTHFHALLEDILKKEKNTIRLVIKKLRLINLLLNILHKWASDDGNIRNSYLASERTLLWVTDFIFREGLQNNNGIDREHGKILQTRLRISYSYIEKVKPQLEIPYGLGVYSHASAHEYSLVSFEQLGIIAEIGLEFLFFLHYIDQGEPFYQVHFERVRRIVDALGNLISNNPGSYLPQYDDHLVDISLALHFFYQTGNFDIGRGYLTSIINRLLEANIFFRGFIPLFHVDYDKLVRVWSEGNKVELSKSSHLLIVVLEWSLAFGYLEGYDLISGACSEPDGVFKAVNLQLWVPDLTTEEEYYQRNVMHGNGTVLTSIQLPKDYREYLKRIGEEKQTFNPYDSFLKSQTIGFLPSLSSRHFRNIPFPRSWRQYIN